MSDDCTVYHLHDPDLPPAALEDHMKPPAESILVHCLHCGQEYESYEMIWVPFTEDELQRHDRSHMEGFWRCPMEGCGGAGFTCDIWPVDPDYVDPETGEKYCHDDPPMIEGHESDCECAECEMLRHAEEAELDREIAEYEEKVKRGEIKPPQAPLTEEDIPF